MRKRFPLPLLLSVLTLLPACSDDDPVTTPESRPYQTDDSTAFTTGLPVIEITTDDGKSITGRETWYAGTLTFKGGDLYGNFTDSIQIKGRGNASLPYPKKSYTLKFRNRQSLLGMPKHKRWVLQANFHDRTLLRNALTFHLSHFADGMEWNPHAEFAEVILNGIHIGNYLVCEQIRADRNRVPIDEGCIGQEDCGFIFEYDTYFDSGHRFYSPIFSFPVCLSYPKEEDCSDASKRYAERFIRLIENAVILSSYNRVFDEFFDLDSFVDYWIILTLTGNVESKAPRSVYFYKKPGGKFYAGPLWDFDFTTYLQVEGTDNTGILYYTWLFRSSKFRDRVRERWQQLAPVLRQEAYQYITYHKTYLHRSEEVNYAMWPISGAYAETCRNGDEMLPFDIAIDNMLSKTMARIDYMDQIVQGLD